MAIFSTILFIAVCSYLNHLRGQSKNADGSVRLPYYHASFSILMGLAYMVYSRDMLDGAIVALGMFFWCVWRWGKLLQAISGFSPKARLEGIGYGMLRGLFLLPILAGIAWHHHAWGIMWLSLILPLQGLVYGAMYYSFDAWKFGVIKAEYVWGWVLGCLLVLVKAYS